MTFWLSRGIVIIRAALSTTESQNSKILGLTAEYTVTPKVTWNPWFRGYVATRVQ